ncbi:MAG: VWA domain-containing protein [Bacteroidia bacterium]|nr:VWA domain-containing protein [Bacteroidia bacterium]
MKTLLFFSAMALSGLVAKSHVVCSTTLKSVSTHSDIHHFVFPPDGSSKIQVALLFDTSNSMDGLIEQAKSRLWDIVNTLTTLKYQGKTPVIEIALYEYGNDGLSVATNYIRQVTPLTTDLDLISEKLFALKTNGGSEYCGAVIQSSVKELKWDDGLNTMKLVYIAGNEGFNQGSVHYKEAISSALKNNIYINTIFCGNKQEGISLFWQDGATKGQGKYFNIDSDKKVEYVQTPYDSQINACNDKLNKTYIGYGKQGYAKKQSQVKEDANASSISQANATERVLTKSKAVYKNSTWDLVDNVKDNESNLDKIKTEDLPEEYKNKSKEEIKTLVLAKAKEREMIQKEIGELAVKRQKYIAEKSKQNTKQDDLGSAIKSSIVAFASVKGYKVED